MKKAQGSFEFIILISIVFMIVIGSLSVIQARMNGIIKDQQHEYLSQLGSIITNEFISAETIRGSYYREFDLPQRIGGFSYNITISGPSEISMKLEGSEFVVYLSSNVSGTIKRGKNVLKKYPDGKVTLNL